MSAWRRRRKKRLARSPASPAAGASVSQAEGSAHEQLELPVAAPAETPIPDAEPPSTLLEEAAETPLGADPAVVFELPEESHEAMPELRLPPQDSGVLEAEFEPDSTAQVSAPLDMPDSTAQMSAPPETPDGIADVSGPAPGPAPDATAEAREPMPALDLTAEVSEPAVVSSEALVEASAPAPASKPRPIADRPPPPSRARIGAPGVDLRADRVVHSPLAGPRRRSARDVQLDLDAAEREAASEALSAAGEEEEAVSGSAGPLEPVIPITGLAQAALSPAEVAAATKVAIEQLPGRAARVETCPFLRSIAAGALQAPRDLVDGRNRCAAFGEPLPLSRMQQGLVCLQPAHETCPRYVRGALLIQQRIAPATAPPRQLPVQIAALLLLLAVLAVIAYLLLGGRLEPQPGVVPSSSPTPSPSVTASAEPAPTPSATATATPTPTPRQTRAPTAPPTPLPAQYRGLQRCAAPQTCYVYVVQRGDTLSSIARRFDTTVATLRRLNPQIRDDFLRVGQKVRVPPP